MNDNENMPRRTILIDSSSVLHRCFHGYPPRLISYEGETINIGAIDGYFDYIRRLMGEFPFDRLIHILDPEDGSNYRLELYPEYKANRSESDPVFTQQKRLMSRVMAALGQQFIQIDGVESDDILGCLNKKAAAEGDFILIVSQDKDLFQLIDDSSTLMVRYVDRKGEVGKVHQQFDERGVFNEMGVRPDQIPDYLAIVGDSSDNIPGIDGAGPKTAVKWLSEHGTLLSLLTHSDSIKGKVGDTLRANKENLILYQKLTTLQCDLETIDFPEAAATTKEDYYAWREHLSYKAGSGLPKMGWEIDFPEPQVIPVHTSQTGGPRFR